MHGRRILLILALAVLAAALILPAVTLAGPAIAHGSGMLTYDQAIDYLFAKGYPNNIETYLDNLGTSPLGYRLAGTPADNEAAYYLADKLSAVGLRATMERVPVDVWDVRGAVSPWAATSSSVRSSPACRAPTKTASRRTSCTWAAAWPPTTRAST